MRTIAQKYNYRNFMKIQEHKELDTYKIFPEDKNKKTELDKEIREAINKEFFNLLKKDNYNDDDKKMITEFIKSFIREKQYYFTEKEDKEDFIMGIVNDIFGLGILEGYIKDPTIQEIWVRGTEGIYYEKEGKRIKGNIRFQHESSVRSLINKILAPINRKADESNPYVDARLPDGSRVAITLPPLSLKGPQITIRKFKQDKFTLDDYVKIGSASPEMAEFLKWSVKGGLNILVAGGTGSGKTTLLNALTNEIPVDRGNEHLITIEDSAELVVYQDFVSSWETKNSNAEGVGGVSSSELLKHALRNSPDRIILGEMRDKVAYDVLQAVNTGHDGTMSTIHSENPAGTVNRFADLAATSGIITAQEAKRSFGNSFDLIVYLSKVFDPDTKETSRKITRVTYVAGSGFQGASRLKLNISMDKIDPYKVFLQDIYKYDEIKKKFITTGFFPQELDKKLQIKGYQYPVGIFEVKK